MDGPGPTAGTGVAADVTATPIIPSDDAHEVARRAALSARTRRRHTSNRSARRHDLVAVGVIAVVAAALGAVLSTAAPTGTGWIDALERALLAGSAALAGSRARRWSLVPGAVIVTAGSTGASALAGVAALLATVFLVERRVRSRAVGAAIGAVVGVLALRIAVPGPTGTETVLAALATLPVLVSGYRRSTLRVRRKVRRGLGVAVAVAGLALLVTAVAAALSTGSLRRAVSATDRAMELARDGRGSASAAALDDAHRDLSTARGLIGSWWAGGARAIPGVGANVAAVQRAVDAGLKVTGRAALVSHSEFDAIQRDGGGVDLAELDRLAPRLAVAETALSDAGAALRDSDSTWIVGPLRTRLGSLERRVRDAEASARDAVAVTDGLPAMLGADGPRRYLFLLGNPAELRDLGGHIGNWVELVATDGRIELAEVGRPRDLISTEPVTSFAGRFPVSFLEMDPLLHPQNLGASPDLPTVALLTSEMFEARTDRTVDGVAYAGPAAFAAFVEITGPVPVPGLPGFELTATNAVDFLTRDQFTLFPTEQAANDSLDEVIRTVFDRLTDTKLPGPQRLVRMFGPLVDTGQFRIASRHGADDRLLERFALTGAVPAADGGDLLGVFNRNANPSKIDTYLERTVRDRIDWDPATGSVWSSVTVDLRNTVPAGGVNRVVGGNSAGAPPGTNVTDLVVMTPFRLTLATVDGVEAAAQPLFEDGVWRHTVRVAVPAGTTKRVELYLQGAVDPGPVYRLTYVGQSLVRPGDADIVVYPVRGRLAQDRRSGTEAGGTVRFSQALDRSVAWRVEG